MAIVAIEAQKRDQKGSKYARRYRRQGMVPGIFYIHGHESVPLLFNFKSLTNFLSRAHGLISLKVEGEKEERNCVVKDVQYDPVTQAVQHLDLQGVTMGEKIELSVPLVLKGTPAGVKLGGIVEQSLFELDIECFPRDIPDHLEYDISAMEIGDSISVEDLSYDKITILNDPSENVVNVAVPKVVEEVVEEEAEITEPELIGAAEKEEEEEKEEE